MFMKVTKIEITIKYRSQWNSLPVFETFELLDHNFSSSVSSLHNSLVEQHNV